MSLFCLDDDFMIVPLLGREVLSVDRLNICNDEKNDGSGKANLNRRTGRVGVGILSVESGTA